MSGDEGAGTRTHLANERTQLAWWRTGLTAIAVALGIGRVVPELAQSSKQWPYTVVGLGFALYGIALMVYGSRRALELERAIGGDGRRGHPGRALPALALTGMLLGIAVALLILFE